jgi:hypothetical protein
MGPDSFCGLGRRLLEPNDVRLKAWAMLAFMGQPSLGHTDRSLLNSQSNMSKGAIASPRSPNPASPSEPAPNQTVIEPKAGCISASQPAQSHWLALGPWPLP